jgi:nucleoid-associated protein EbfC
VIPGGQPNMQQMLKQAQKMQQDILAAQEELAGAQVEGSAGGGLVRATVTGTGELVGLQIDPKVADPEDTETLADLILAAVRDANRAASELQAKTMGPLAQGLGGGLPGGMPGLPGF